MSNKNQTRKRQRVTGGLHVTFTELGDTLLIEHEGETLELVFQGRDGAKAAGFSLIGPKSFVLNSPKRPKKAE